MNKLNKKKSHSQYNPRTIKIAGNSSCEATHLNLCIVRYQINVKKNIKRETVGVVVLVSRTDLHHLQRERPSYQEGLSLWSVHTGNKANFSINTKAVANMHPKFTQ